MNKRILFALCLALVSVMMLYGCMDRHTDDALGGGAGAPGTGTDAAGDSTSPSSPSETTGNTPEETVASEKTDAPDAETAEDLIDGSGILDEAKNKFIDAHTHFLSENELMVGSYFGEYNGVSAVIVYEKGMAYTQAFWSETVDGVTFSYRDGNRIKAFDGEKFYTLPEAFGMGLLTHDDLVKIASLMPKTGGLTSPQLS